MAVCHLRHFARLAELAVSVVLLWAASISWLPTGLMLSFDLISGFIAPAIQAALLAILSWRKLYRRFPFFYTYTLYSILIIAVRVFFKGYPAPFFVAYWTTEMVYGVLALLAILEVFRPTLEAYFEAVWTRLLPLLALLGIVAVSLWRGFYHPVGRGGFLFYFAAGAYTFMLGVLCLQIIVFAVCLRLAFRRPYPVRWGRYRLGILAGFGLAACASVAAYVARFNLGPRLETFFHYVLPGAYIGATIVWLVAFWGKEAPVSTKTDPEAIRRAMDYLSRETDDVEKDLGLRLTARTPHPVREASN